MHPVRRTTISCRFIAPTAGLLILAATGSTGAGQAAAEPTSQIPPPVLQWFVAIAAAPAAPPALADERVYVALRTGAVVAHQASNGAQLWSAELAAEQPLAFDPTHVFVAAVGAVHALDGVSGRVSWRAATGPLTAPPLVQAGWLIVAAGNALSALRAADGERVWRQEMGPVTARPAIDGDILYASFVDGRVIAFDLHTGEPRWERRLPPPAGEPLAYGDRIYLGSGDKHFYCLDAGDGEIEWRFRVGAETRGRPAADARHVYFAALNNEVRALDRGHGASRWHRGVPFRPSAGPVLVGDTVAVPGPVAELQMFTAATGAPVKGFQFGERIVTAPSVLAAGEPKQLRVAAVTGGLNNEWKLTVFGPAGEIPDGPPLLPLTELPGVVLQPGT